MSETLITPKIETTAESACPKRLFIKTYGCQKSVLVDGADHLLGRIVPVRIEQGAHNSLKGTLVGS